MMHLDRLRATIGVIVMLGMVLNVVVILILHQREWIWADEAIGGLLDVLKQFMVPLAVIVAAVMARGDRFGRTGSMVHWVPAAFAVVLCLLWILLISYPWLGALLTASDEFSRLQPNWNKFIDLVAEVTIVAVVTYFFTKRGPENATT